MGHAQLVIRAADGERRTVTLDSGGDALWIGRGSGRDIVIDWDREVSAMHAQLERSGDDWVLVDDGLSRNGSFVNGERLRGRRRLRDRDVLRFGSTVAQFRAGGHDPRQTAATSEALAAVDVSPAQRRVLVVLCRPFIDSAAFAAPPSNREIAEELVVSVEAVKTHMRALFERFDVDDLPQNRKRLELAKAALQRGVISDADYVS